MDHLCYKCQASIDETLPFCPHCGAPQIRVAAPDDEPPPSPDSRVPHVLPQTWSTGAANYNPNDIRWDIAWKGAFLTGIVAGILTAAPVVSVGCCLRLADMTFADLLAVIIQQTLVRAHEIRQANVA